MNDLASSPAVDVLAQQRGGGIDGERGPAAVAAAQRHGAAALLLRADRGKDRDAGRMRRADLAGEPVRPGIDPHAQILRFERAGDASGIVGLPLADAGDHDLLRGEPERQAAPVVLQQHAEEALDTAEHRVMNEHRPHALAARIGVLRRQSLGQDEIELDGAALPIAPRSVAQGEIELRPVEGALAGEGPEGQAGGSPGGFERGLGAVPQRVRSGPNRRTGREADGEFS